MIGSSLNQMVTAEKMSVDQLRQSIENGTVEAYIGIPLLQSKLKDQQQAQAMQQPVESPPIAQEIMSQAAGVSQLQSNLPTEQYQDGGIVSLAEGGDEFFLGEDDPLLASQEEEEYTNALSGLFNAAQGIAGMANLPTKAMSAYENVTPDVERETLRAQSIPQKAPQQAPQQMPQRASGAPQQMTSQAPQSGINDLISAAAERNSVPSDLLMNIAGAESSGRSDAANPRSSAKGVFQFIDSTWESLGGTPGNQFDPQENVELGARFTRQNAERLKQELGRDPSYAETYAAHYFGPGVSSMLKNADPSDPIEVGLATFTNSRGVDQILRANPNLQGKTVGEVMSSLVAKAGEGIVQLAGGGPIRFNKGDLVIPFKPVEPEFIPGTNIPAFPSNDVVPFKPTDQQVIPGTNIPMYPSGDTFSSLIKTPSETDLIAQPSDPTDSAIGKQLDSARIARENAMKALGSYGSPKKRQDPQGFIAAKQAFETADARVKEIQKEYETLLTAQMPNITKAFTLGAAMESGARTVGGMPQPNKISGNPRPSPSKPNSEETAPAPTDKKTTNEITKILNKPEPAGEKTADFYDLFLKDYMDSKSDKERQRKMDAYMAIATAGFAAAAGSSPNPLQNISQGALAGMGQYAGSQKTRAAEGLAEQKNLLSAQRYRELGEAARATAAMTEVRLTADEQNRMRNALASREKEFADMIANDPMLKVGTPEQQAAALSKLRSNDPLYNELFKPLFGVNYNEYVQQQSGQKEVNTSGYSAKPK
jgi:hypothetical protein